MLSPKHMGASSPLRAELCGAVSFLGIGSIGTRHLRVFRDLVGAEVSAIPVRAIRRSELQASGVEVRSNLKAARACRDGTRHRDV